MYKIYYKDGSCKEFEALVGANLSEANLSKADLSEANLSGADLRWADLRWANLSKANLSEANLSGADLRWADLSGAENILSAIDYIAKNFEKTADGIIVYKTFSEHYSPPKSWVIEVGSVISDVVNFLPINNCACGVNVATKDWVLKETRRPEIWKCLIRWEWLAGVCVPYATDGKIRCERVELVEKLTRADLSGKEDSQ